MIAHKSPGKGSCLASASSVSSPSSESPFTYEVPGGQTALISSRSRDLDQQALASTGAVSIASETSSVKGDLGPSFESAQTSKARRRSSSRRSRNSSENSKMPTRQIFLPYPEAVQYHRPPPIVAYDQNRPTPTKEAISPLQLQAVGASIAHPIPSFVSHPGIVHYPESGPAWLSPGGSTDSNSLSLASPCDEHATSGNRIPLMRRTVASATSSGGFEWFSGPRSQDATAPFNSSANQRTPIENRDAITSESDAVAAGSRMTFLRPSPVLAYHTVSQSSLVGTPIYPTVILSQCALPQAVTSSSYHPLQTVPTTLASYSLLSCPTLPASSGNGSPSSSAGMQIDGRHGRTTSNSDCSLPDEQHCSYMAVGNQFAEQSCSPSSSVESLNCREDNREKAARSEDTPSDEDDDDAVDEDFSETAIEDAAGSSSDQRSSPFFCQWRTGRGGSATLCKLPFYEMSELVDHITQHVNAIADRQFVCLWHNCERRAVPFKAKYKLVNHVRVHTNEKPFVCKAENCGRLFARSENLRIHMRVHSGEKPFRCPHPGCGKSFANSSDRKKHTFVHSQERPYACKERGCGKRYTHPSSLRKHALLHKASLALHPSPSAYA